MQASCPVQGMQPLPLAVSHIQARPVANCFMLYISGYCPIKHACQKWRPSLLPCARQLGAVPCSKPCPCWPNIEYHQLQSALSADSQAAPSLTEKNAAVLGLMSFVLSSPYEVPLWLPDVLLSLIKAASQPAPVKTTVRWAPGQHLDLETAFSPAEHT